MYFSEHERQPTIEIQHSLESSRANSYGAGWPVRIALLLGFLIVLVVEGWLLVKMLF